MIALIQQWAFRIVFFSCYAIAMYIIAHDDETPIRQKIGLTLMAFVSALVILSLVSPAIQ